MIDPRPSRRTFLAAAAALALTACNQGGGDGSGSVTPAGAGAGDPPGSTTTSAPSSGPGPAGATTTSAPAGDQPVEARFVVSGPATRDEVALTFHTNGDLALAQRLLDALAAHDAPATCFIIGSWLEANPTWATKLVDAGHEPANHTYSHPDRFTTLSTAAMSAEITKCRDVLRRLTGTGGRLFRPSGTDDGRADPGAALIGTAGQAGYPVVAGFDVDPLDYRDPGTAAVRDRTLAEVGAGSIVSLHFGHPGTVEALPAILDGLAAKGLRPVTLSQLLT